MSLDSGVARFKEDTAPVKRGDTHKCMNFMSKIGPYGGPDPSDKVIVGMGVTRRKDSGSWTTMMNAHALLSTIEATGNSELTGGMTGAAYKHMLPKTHTSASAAYTAVGTPGGKYDILAYNTLTLDSHTPFGATVGVSESTGKFIAATRVAPTLVVHPGPVFSLAANRF